jgi:single-stranded DNA-binding protein
MSGIECALFGTLGDDATARTSNSGKPYLRVRIRVGEGDAGQWLSALVFDEEAVAVSDKLAKGARVYLEGTVKLDEWKAQDGTKRHGLLVISSYCRLAQIGRQKDRTDASRPATAARGSAPSYGDAGSDIPF